MNRAYSVLTVKSVDEELRTIEGIATTPATDRMEDIVVPGGAKFTLPIPLLYQHNSRQPIGHVIAAKVTDDGISIKAQIAKGVVPFIDEAWALIKAGLVRGLSIGFRPLSDPTPIKGTYGLKFDSWEWFELSAVTIPANSEASILSIKSADEPFLRAASGENANTAVTLKTLPGASGKPVKLIPKDHYMKTAQDHIKSLEASRQAKAARMSALMEAVTEKGETLDEAGSQEFDGLKGDVQIIDKDLKRFRDLDALNIEKAVEIKPDAGTDPEKAEKARSGIISVKSNLPKGTAFTRYAMAMAASKGNYMQGLEIAKQWHDSTPEVEMLFKAAVAAGTTTDSTWAAPLALPNTVASEFVELLRPATIVGRIPGLRKVPFNVRFPRTTAGSTAGWVGEGAAKPVSRMSFDTMTMLFTKIASIVVLTQELVRFSNPSAEATVRDDMIKAIGQYTDQQFINPAVSASSGVRPASITNGLTVHNSAGATVANVFTDIATAMGPFFTANLNPSVWVMNPRTAFALSQLRTANDIVVFPTINAQGGTFQGLPVIVSGNVPIGTDAKTIIVLMAADEILLADDGGVTLDMSDQASVQMDGAPTTGAIATISLWQHNMVGLRAERYINWQRRRDAAVVLISNVTY